MRCEYKWFQKRLMYCSFSFILFVTLCGCAAGLREAKPLDQDIVICEVNERPQVTHEGSLWQDNGLLSSLFINPKARNVGDIVTIRIVESSKATNKATTGTGRSSSVEAGIDGFLGMEKRYPTNTNPYFNPFSKITGSLASKFDGSGTTHRSGDLTAYLTARVTDVLPNGNLKIVGSRQVAVNNEKQYMTLSGIIRPRDISPDNVILSTYISDARIAYSGTGVVDDRQRPGWLANILNKIWPF